MYNNNRTTYQQLNNIDAEIYVGSTTQPLYKIMFEKGFKAKCYGYNCQMFNLMREIGQDSCYIEILEAYPCNSKEE